jgi:histone acetyltransferase
MMSSRNQWVHQPPVSVSVSDHKQLVWTDFSTMEHKLTTNQYTSLDAFLEDAQLVFDNCRLYNPEASIYAKNATRVEKFMKDELAERARKGD